MPSQTSVACERRAPEICLCSQAKTSHKLSRIGFESLERVKLAIPLCGHVVEHTLTLTLPW